MRCAETTAAELLALADHVATVPHPELRSAWARACAILARRALEAAVDALWKQRTGDMPDRTQVSMRAKLLCLGEFVDADVAEDVAYTWSSLSRACHHHPYELAPSGVELQSLLETVKRLVSSLTVAST